MYSIQIGVNDALSGYLAEIRLRLRMDNRYVAGRVIAQGFHGLPEAGIFVKRKR